MILKDKVSFDSSDCRVEIPKKYADKFSNIIFIPSTYFKYFNYCSVYNVNFPTIEDYMKSLGLSEKDYLVFGESLGYGWSDAGCNVLYAVATNIAFTRDECLNALDIMWRNWQFNHVKDGLIITSGNDMYIERTDAKSAFFKGYQYGCAYQGYIVLDKVSKDTYKCFKQGKEGVLTRDEIIQHVQCNNVLNAKVSISKNGSVRLSVKSIDNYIYN